MKDSTKKLINRLFCRRLARGIGNYPQDKGSKKRIAAAIELWEYRARRIA